MMKLWWIEIISCAYLTGLILIVHFLHYPAFAKVKESVFKEFVTWHGRRITPIVFPAMVIELGCAILLLIQEKSARSGINLASVVLVWAVTGIKSARTHSKLMQIGFSQIDFDDLMRWNQVRTWIWCLRLIGLSVVVWIYF